VLHEFLAAHRTELIDRCRVRVARRPVPAVTDAELEHGVPLFLDQLIKTLRVEQTPEPMRSRKVSGPSGGGMPVLCEIGVTAARHGRELLQQGFTIDQVVQDYGDLCQAVTDLAFEHGAPFEIDEFRTLNRCLDNAVAEAVTEFSYAHDVAIAEKALDAFSERQVVFAHQLRDLVHTATMAVTAMKAGQVTFSGATGGVLDRSLEGLSTLIERSLTEVRVPLDTPARHPFLSLADFIADVTTAAYLEAQVRGCRLTVTAVDANLAVCVDRDMLSAALGNLLHNAFKFARPHTEVALDAYATADRILIDVEDHCGGLPPGEAETIFLPFTQAGEDKSGPRLGLASCRRSVEANNGTLSVRDVPGTGCIFTIDLPRFLLPTTSLCA
jgi:signal transduction histidine kinase